MVDGELFLKLSSMERFVSRGREEVHRSCVAVRASMIAMIYLTTGTQT